jgi:glycosyltransferase involved in cell wall biosynthesis
MVYSEADCLPTNLWQQISPGQRQATMHANRLNILHINNYAGGGGADLAYRASVDAMNNHTDCTNWTASIAELDNQDLTFKGAQAEQGINKLRYIYSTGNNKLLSEFLQTHKPDILHAHGFYSEISPSILTAIKKAKQQWGMKFVQTAHSHELICANATAFDYTQNRICTDCKGNRMKLKIFYRNCERRGWVYSWAKGLRCFVAQVLLQQSALTDMVLCPSELMLKNLQDEGIPKTKLSLVRNPINMQRHTQTDRRQEIVYFGRFAREKNLVSVIEAFDVFRTHQPDWKLLLIGEGEEKQVMEQTIARLGAETSIELLPFLSQSALYERIKQCQMMVMASHVLENLPMVVAEAIMCGLYPIVPDHGGMKEAIDWLGVGSDYRSGDTTSLTNAFLKALERDTTSADLEYAQHKIETETGSSAYVTQVMQVYQSLVST